MKRLEVLLLPRRSRQCAGDFFLLTAAHYKVSSNDVGKVENIPFTLHLTRYKNKNTNSKADTESYKVYSKQTSFYLGFKRGRQ